MPPTSETLPGRVNGLRRRLLIVTLVVGIGLAGCLGTWFYYRSITPSPPDLDLTGLDPAVVSLIEQARAAVTKEPRSAAAWGRLGMVLAAHERTGEANRSFAQAERLDPTEPRWPYHQGVALTLGAPEEALPKLRRAAERCSPENEAVFLRLAELLLLQGHLDEAARWFETLLQQSKAQPRAHLGLARLALARGDLEQSLSHLGPALTDPRTQKAAHQLLATIEARRGDGTAAAEARARADRMPDDPLWPDPFIQEVWQFRTGKQAELSRADELLRQDRVAEAVSLLQRTVRTYPDSDWGWYLLGKALNRRQEWEASEQALRRAAQLAPGAPEVQFYLGVALYHRRDYHAAAAAFQRATELKPSYDLAHFNLGHCRDLAGDPAGADAALQAALRCNPELVEAHAARADLLIRQRRSAEAFAHLQKALQLKPAEPRARKLLNGLLRQMCRCL